MALPPGPRAVAGQSPESGALCPPPGTLCPLPGLLSPLLTQSLALLTRSIMPLPWRAGANVFIKANINFH